MRANALLEDFPEEEPTRPERKRQEALTLPTEQDGTYNQINLSKDFAGNLAQLSDASYLINNILSPSSPRYIEVPPTILPTLPRQGASPLPDKAYRNRGCSGVSPAHTPGRGGYRNSAAQRNEPRSGQPNSSRKGSSITCTPSVDSYQPTSLSEIAVDALMRLLSLPETDPRRKDIPRSVKFVEYLKCCEQKGFKLSGWDSKKGKMVTIPLDYTNRWGEKRRKEVSRKLDYLEEFSKDKTVTMITMTRAHNPSDNCSDHMKDLNEGRRLLLKMVKKHCGAPDYFWLAEPHPEKDAGFAHYHLAVFADVSIPLENKLRNLWSTEYCLGSHTYGLDFSRPGEMGKVEDLARYLAKYLRPGFLLDGWSIGTLIFNATLFLDELRLYGCSNRLAKILNEPKQPSPIIWLSNDLERDYVDPENKEVHEVRTIWERKLIPNWLDNQIWNEWSLSAEKEPLGVSDDYWEWGRRLIDPTKSGYDPTNGKITYVHRETIKCTDNN